MDERPTLSIVIPVYNEQDVLPALFARLDPVLDSIGAPCEVVFVDDGSRDRSPALLREKQAADARVVVAFLSRNFGHQAALSAGLRLASGRAVVLMDADLQDPPEVIPELVAKWREGYKVVLAQRESRRETGLRRVLLDGFYAVFRFVGEDVRVESGIFGLMDRTVVDHLNSFTERNRFLPGLRDWVGFATSAIHYHRDERLAGKEKQTLRKLLAYGADAVFSFSRAPLRISFLAGIAISGLAFAYGLVRVVMRLLGIDVVPGFTTTTVAILFLSGVQLVTIGILGEYVGRIYDEVKKRPLYIVDEVLRAKPTSANDR
jgi:dolichol-phosphate mannosyltransferase